MITQVKIEAPICKKHGYKKYRRPNSTIWVCPQCLNEQNKDKLRQAFGSDKKGSENGLKSGKKKRGKTPRQKAMDRADEWFSRYIRCKYAFWSNGEWFCRCYTCGTHKKIAEIQNGHWRRRGFKTTRFHEHDARPQCVKCNYHRSGEPEIFERNLIQELGQEKVEEIRALSLQLGRDDEQFYREMSDKYRKLTNQLIKEKGIPKWW